MMVYSFGCPLDGESSVPTKSGPKILLANLGSPEEPTPRAVRAFLAEFLSDPLVVDLPRWLWLPLLHGVILRTRPRPVARAYRQIWRPGGSPLREGTSRMAQALQAKLGPGITVTPAYRYGHPSVVDAGKEGGAGTASPLLLLPLFPQPTGATTGTLLEAVGGRGVHAVELPPDAEGYIGALAARVREAMAREEVPPQHLVISFHGLPVRQDQAEGQVYSRACAATAAALQERLSWDPAELTLAYQSRFGREAWLEPATDHVLRGLPGRGVERVLVVCPGFLTDGLETLQEIGIRGRETFQAAGGDHLCLARAVEDHPLVVAEMARRVHAVLAGIQTPGEKPAS